MKRIVLLILILGLSVCLSSGSQIFGEPCIESVQKAAENGFEQMKDSMFNLGFCSEDEWTNAELGMGFPIYKISYEMANEKLNDKSHLSLSDIIEPSGEYYYMIMTDKKAVAMLFVGLINGEWKVAGIGHNGIAVEMNNILSELEKKGGYTFRFIRFQRENCDILQINSESWIMGKENMAKEYIPLLSAKILMGISTDAKEYPVINEKDIINAFIKDTPDEIDPCSGSGDTMKEEKN